VRELAHGAAAAGVLVCYGTSGADATVPHQPLRDWLEFILRVCDARALATCAGDGIGARGVIADLRDVEGRPAWPAREEAKADRYLLHAAVSNFWRQLGDLRPLLLVAEDIHWSDAERCSCWNVLRARHRRRVCSSSRPSVSRVRRSRASSRRPSASPGWRGNGSVSAASVPTWRLRAWDGARRSRQPACGCARRAHPRHGAAHLRALARNLPPARPSRSPTSAFASCGRWRSSAGPQRLHELMEQRLLRLAPGEGDIELAAVAGPRFELGVVAAAAGLSLSALTRRWTRRSRAGSSSCGTCRCLRLHARVAAPHDLTGSAASAAELHLRVGEALGELM
jgi:hypothetical protein